MILLLIGDWDILVSYPHISFIKNIKNEDNIIYL